MNQTITRWDPFRDLASLQTRLNSLLSDTNGSTEDSYGPWRPPVDIFERGDDLVIRAELPGIKTDDIDIRVENNTLPLRGERKHESEVEDGKAYRLERSFGTFTRSFSLPTTVDSAAISAKHADGILEIVLPKVEQAKPRRIEIGTSSS